MKDKDLRMKILEQLMDAMDDKNAERLMPKGKGDMAVIEEKQMVPADEVGDVLRKKLGQAARDDEDDAESEEREAMDDDEDGEAEEDFGSRLMQRLNAAKSARKMKC